MGTVSGNYSIGWEHSRERGIRIETFWKRNCLENNNNKLKR
jgi:hypothetical protein